MPRVGFRGLGYRAPPGSGLGAKLGYRPDLDGLRGVAVLLVLLCHAHFPIDNNGGDVGVTAFFVLSGYLITRLLFEEWARVGRIDLRAFYARRVIRLAPALLVLLLFVTVIGAWRGWAPTGSSPVISTIGSGLWDPDRPAGSHVDPCHRGAVLPGLASRVDPPRGATCGVGCGSCKNRGGCRLAQTEATGTLEYFSTVTRGDAILVGCLLAMRPVRIPHSFGFLALAALIILAFVDWSHDITIPLVISASAIVITSEVGVLSVLAPVGRRAYALYLWDWPLTILLGSVGGLVAIPAATLSYRLVERRAVRAWARRATRSSRAKVEDADGRVTPGVPPLAGTA